ncbi:2OG-Fe(II) oxygenase [Sphingomonas sp.]|uniref:prolyl hydroxylase family protein n=1 Tax=Sphingomonas sp. TaxID=28214 RepID=UPI003D6CB1B4
MSSDAVKSAYDALAAGEASQAEALLRSAGNHGDPDALFEFACWYLAGDKLPRNLPMARGLLKRAVEIGHVDAALMDIAFTANGTGGSIDWQGAVSLLESASKSDALAAQHLELLTAMSLDEHGAPLAIADGQLLNSDPKIRHIPGFCSPIEAAHIVSIVLGSLEPATVLDPVSGKQIAHSIRTADYATVGPAEESLVVQAINRRIAAATGTAVFQGEPTSVMRYGIGQQYRLHMDALPVATNQRITTAILYLNHGFTGGQTIFPQLDLIITPHIGDLLIFDNVDTLGRPEQLSRHAGLPVTAGTKWIATRWIREKSYNPWTDYGK